MAALGSPKRTFQTDKYKKTSEGGLNPLTLPPGSATGYQGKQNRANTWDLTDNWLNPNLYSVLQLCYTQ